MIIGQSNTKLGAQTVRLHQLYAIRCNEYQKRSQWYG